MFIYAIQHLFQKIVSLAHCVQGWAAALLFFLADYFAGHQFTVFFVLSMTLMDAIWGIAVSIKIKKTSIPQVIYMKDPINYELSEINICKEFDNQDVSKQ